MKQSMTIFSESFALDDDNQATIIAMTKCGNLVPIYLDPNVYYGAKETPWANSLMVEPVNLECLIDNNVECVYEFSDYFDELDNGNTEALILDIPAFLVLKDQTEIIDDNDLVIDDDEQVTVFEDYVNNG